MYRYLLLDFDNTLVDFNETERRALSVTFDALYKRKLSKEEIGIYHRINDSCWKMLERKEIDKPELKRLRFEQFTEAIGIKNADVGEINRTYMDILSKTVVEYPDSFETCRILAKNHTLFVITNGTAYVQKDRLAGASFAPFISGLFISDEIGVNKPAPEFFDAIIKETQDTKRSSYLIVGDSPTSDILFGKNAGVDTCYVGAGESDADYRIGSIGELPQLLRAISDKEQIIS
ncbi:MAG: HAD-IA family hydrolase [Lachnospiraceae bacterium]|nr:HAD-IA family hydrolase [Lachnospiraceae bacterium]